MSKNAELAQNEISTRTKNAGASLEHPHRVINHPNVSVANT